MVWATVIVVAAIAVAVLCWWRQSEHLTTKPPVRRRLRLKYTHPFGLGFSPDGKTLYVTGDSTLVAYAVDEQTLKLTPVKKRKASASMLGLAVSPDGTRLAVARRTSVALYDASSLQLLASFPTEKGATTIELAFSHDGTLIAASDEYKHRVGVYDVAKMVAKDPTALVGFIPAGKEPVGVQCARGPNGELLAAFTNQRERIAKCTGSVRIADLKTLNVLQKIPAGCNPVRLTGFTGLSGNVCVTSRANNKVMVLDVATKKIVSQIQVGTAPVGIGVHENIAVVACSNRFNKENGSIDIVDLAAGRVINRLPGLLFPRTVAMSPTGAVAAVVHNKSAAVDLISISAATS